MHEPAGVVEILVQNPQNTPYSEVQNTPPPNENCQRVQIQEFQKTPRNENCQRVWIREFQNTPPMKIVTESESESFRIPPPQKKSEKLQISNFRIVLQPGRSYVETNL